MGFKKDLGKAQEAVKEKKETYSSWMDALFGPDREERPLGEKLAGGTDHGRELADEIIDSFDNKLDPEEQKMVRKELKKAIKRKKRKKVKKLALKKLDERKVKEKPGDLPIAIGSAKGKEKKSKDDKSLDEIGDAIVGLGGSDKGSKKAKEFGGGLL